MKKEKNGVVKGISIRYLVTTQTSVRIYAENYA